MLYSVLLGFYHLFEPKQLIVLHHDGCHKVAIVLHGKKKTAEPRPQRFRNCVDPPLFHEPERGRGQGHGTVQDVPKRGMSSIKLGVSGGGCPTSYLV